MIAGGRFRKVERRVKSRLQIVFAIARGDDRAMFPFPHTGFVPIRRAPIGRTRRDGPPCSYFTPVDDRAQQSRRWSHKKTPAAPGIAPERVAAGVQEIGLAPLDRRGTNFIDKLPQRLRANPAKQDSCLPRRADPRIKKGHAKHSRNIFVMSCVRIRGDSAKSG